MKMNLLFISVDDLRPVTGCYGGPAITPHLDRFSKTACQFQRHYVQYPACGASRASLLSGLRPRSLGVYDNANSTEIAIARPDIRPTLPFYLSQSGYNPYAFGKLYHSRSNLPGAGWTTTPWFPAGDWRLLVDFQASSMDPPGYFPAYEVYQGRLSLHGDHLLADQLIKAIRDSGKKPFALFGGFLKPHLPFVTEKRFWDLYQEAGVPRPEISEPPKHGVLFNPLYREITDYGYYSSKQGKRVMHEALPTGHQLQLLRRAYMASVSMIDYQIGRILSALRESGLDDNTIVVIWGDHGLHLGERGIFGKGSPYETDLRSPLWIRIPGRTLPGLKTKALVETIDIYPTIIKALGIEKPNHLSGINLGPIISGKKDIGKPYTLSELINNFPHGRNVIYSLRSKDYRYIQWRNNDKSMKIKYEELYHMKYSLVERENLVGNISYRKILTEHRKAFAEKFPGYSAENMERHTEVQYRE